jgi:hypothetical protein
MIRHGLVHDSPGYVCPFCPDREHKYPRPDNLQRYGSPYCLLINITYLDTTGMLGFITWIRTRMTHCYARFSLSAPKEEAVVGVAGLAHSFFIRVYDQNS